MQFLESAQVIENAGVMFLQKSDERKGEARLGRKFTQLYSMKW